MGMSACWLTSEHAACWWRPLEVQGFLVGCRSDHNPQGDISMQEHSRYVADNNCQLLAAVAERLSVYADGMTHVLCFRPTRGLRHHRPFFRAVMATLLASGAKLYHPSTDCRILLVLAPGASFEELEGMLLRQKEFSVEATLVKQGALRKAYSAVKHSQGRVRVEIDIGVGIDPPSGQLVPFANLHWARRLLDWRGIAAAKAAHGLAENLILAGAVKADPVLQWQAPIVPFWELLTNKV